MKTNENLRQKIVNKIKKASIDKRINNKFEWNVKLIVKYNEHNTQQKIQFFLFPSGLVFNNYH